MSSTSLIRGLGLHGGTGRGPSLWLAAPQVIPAAGPGLRAAAGLAVAAGSYAVFADGCGWLKAAVRQWPPVPGCTVVALGTELTDPGLIILLTAIRHAVRQGGRLVLVHAGAGGTSLLQALGREQRTLHCRSIEIEPAARAATTAWRFAIEPGTGHSEIIIDRHGNAHAAGWTAVPVPDAPAPVSAGDAVVVTGGLGGLGRAIALHLSRRFAAHPVLVDRAAAAPAPELSRLRAGRRSFTVITADVTQAGALRQALRPLAWTRRVRAVIHCAGSIEGGAVHSLTRTDLTRLITPKVAGLRNTLAALEPRQPSAVLAFGSILARQPHSGVGAYALANELLRREVDRCARRYPGPRFLTAEWSIWDGAGVAAETGAVPVARAAGYSPISLADGLRLVESLLAWPGPGTSAVVSALAPGSR